MSVPTRAKGHLETVASLKTTSPSSAEANQAAVQLRFVADDLEVAQDIRARSNQLATALAAPPTTEDGARRESLMMAGNSFARANI